MRTRIRAHVGSGQLHWTVIVAVIAVRMVQMPIHQVVDVIAVRHRRVPAARSVHVARVVAGAVVRHASVGVGLRDLDAMLVVVIVVRAMQVPVVQVPHMISVPDGDVAAVGAMRVRVALVDLVVHGEVPS